MIHLQIAETLTDHPLQLLKNENFFVQTAQAALRLAPDPDGHRLEQDNELTIVLTEDTQIQELNLQYRDIDAPTDVLSFPAGDVDLDSGCLYLGDIIISIPRALTQAEAEKHSIEDELSLLVVHGVLHLLGYDHADDEERTAMWLVQTNILSNLKSI